MTVLSTLRSARANLVDDVTYEADWRPEIDASDVQLLEVDFTGGAGRQPLFDATARALHLPAETGIRTWSGFQDRIWEKLTHLESSRVLIVIRRADGLLADGLGDLLEVVSILEELGRQVDGGSADFPRELDLLPVLTGIGPNFPR